MPTIYPHKTQSSIELEILRVSLPVSSHKTGDSEEKVPNKTQICSPNKTFLPRAKVIEKTRANTQRRTELADAGITCRKE